MATTEAGARVEQDRLVRGKGQFLDDVKLPGMCLPRLCAVLMLTPGSHASSLTTPSASTVPLPC
ncbi:hypothetical protein [Candidatus Entotheonella palauensis]|uniref:hypothetical protein n=1 Tax=Candidatus Entotheonella palauensis TaxID=93172 RepID=UPI0021196896|nr:hypothetical protein [Candidatus Entotheonella palauensis]